MAGRLLSICRACTHWSFHISSFEPIAAGIQRSSQQQHITKNDRAPVLEFFRQPQLKRYSSLADHRVQVDRVNELFALAREEIDNAKEDADTVYFNESAAEAKKAVEETFTAWDALVTSLPESEKLQLLRSMGLKMEQLKAEMQQLETMHT